MQFRGKKMTLAQDMHCHLHTPILPWITPHFQSVQRRRPPIHPQFNRLAKEVNDKFIPVLLNTTHNTCISLPKHT